MSELGKKVLEKIKEEKIEPRPKWHFLLKNYVFWSAFLISVAIGSIAFCVMLTLFFDNDWDIHKYLGISPLRYILVSLPYFWIAALILFSILSYYYYRRTERGYCCGAILVVIASVAASILLGIFFHLTGLGRAINHSLASSFPVYEKILCCNHRRDIWDQPEKGLLAGEVKEMFENDGFKLEDFGGLIWQVEKDEKTLIPAGFLFIVGKNVKLIGEKKAEKIFRAREVRPWEREDD